MKRFLCLVFLFLFALPLCRAGLYHQFFTAVRRGDQATVKKMMRKNKEMVFLSDPDGTTPFLAAVETKNVSMAFLLADHWSRLWASNGEGNALHIAAANEDGPMIKMILRMVETEGSAASKQMVNARRVQKRAARLPADLNTPLHVAAQTCNRVIYRYLTQHGADPSIPNAALETPAQILARCPKETKKKQLPPAAKKADASAAAAPAAPF